MKHEVIRRENGSVDGKATLPVALALIKSEKLSVMSAAKILGLTRGQLLGILYRHGQNNRHKTAKLPWSKEDKCFQRSPQDNYRPNTCQYIEGNILTDEHKCGKPVKTGSSYCKEHHARCYTKHEPSPS